jgi:hypothetical protein
VRERENRSISFERPNIRNCLSSFDVETARRNTIHRDDSETITHSIPSFLAIDLFDAGHAMLFSAAIAQPAFVKPIARRKLGAHVRSSMLRAAERGEAGSPLRPRRQDPGFWLKIGVEVTARSAIIATPITLAAFGERPKALTKSKLPIYETICGTTARPSPTDKVLKPASILLILFSRLTKASARGGKRAGEVFQRMSFRMGRQCGKERASAGTGLPIVG